MGESHLTILIFGNAVPFPKSSFYGAIQCLGRNGGGAREGEVWIREGELG